MKQLRNTGLKRFLRSEKKKLSDKAEIIFLLFSVDYQANLGSLFRDADGIGAKKIYLTGGTIEPEGHIFEKVARYKHRVVDWEKVRDPNQVIIDLKKDGFKIVAVEITDKSVRFDKYKYKNKLCLVMGNEGHGLPDKILNQCDAAVFIPMIGKGMSLNVSTSAAIVGFAAKMIIDG